MVISFEICMHVLCPGPLRRRTPRLWEGTGGQILSVLYSLALLTPDSNFEKELGAQLSAMGVSLAFVMGLS